MDPGIKPWSEGMQSVNREQIGRQQAQTALLTLAEEKQKQAAQQAMFERIKNDPELAQRLFGDGSVIGSLQTAPGGPPGGGPMTQQSVMPGQPPGAPQMVPGGQDLSQFATQGQPGTPTLATLGGQPQGPPQAPQNPLLEMAKRDPRAALMLYDRQTKMQEQRLDMGTKIAGSVARIVQGVTDQPSLDKAREEISLFDQRAAAQLPQFYSKEALEPFIKRAFTAQETAEVRLKTWQQQNEERKNQLEEMKIGVQLTNAGYQGLGTDVTSILRGLTPEQVQQFGGRTTPAAIAHATEQVRKLDVEKREKEGLAGAQATAQAGREARQQQTLSEAFKGETVNLYDTQTGRPLPSRMKVADYEQLPQTQVAQLSDDNRKQMENVNSAMPRLQILQTHIDAVYGPGGVLERMSPADRELVRSPLAIPNQIAEQFAQKYPELAAARKYIDANAESLARALSGVRGAATEGDVERAKAMLPNLTAALKVWPLSEAGLSLPDTRETALRTMNNLVDTLNGIGTGILGNADYRTPLKKYEDPANVPGPGLRKGEGSVRITPSNAPRQAPRGSTPPAAQPPAAAVPAPGAPIFPPAPAIRIPGETAAPATPPAPPTATSTPAQDEAYRRSLAPPPAPTPAPSAPAPRSTPGRQSQAKPGRHGIELARASGIKVLDQQDIAEAVAQTGRSREEVIQAARQKGYRIYGGGTAVA